jgi:hypothetical protein
MKSALQAMTATDDAVDKTLYDVNKLVENASKDGDNRVQTERKLTGKQLARLRRLGYKVDSTRTTDELSWRN